VDEHLLDGLERGDLILVRWRDASELRTGLGQHVERPEVYVKDIGVYLGIAGARNRYIVVGKDVVELWNEWGLRGYPSTLSSRLRA
jgi:hypothetical protein